MMSPDVFDLFKTKLEKKAGEKQNKTAKTSIDPKFVELKADVLEIFL